MSTLKITFDTETFIKGGGAVERVGVYPGSFEGFYLVDLAENQI